MFSPVTMPTCGPFLVSNVASFMVVLVGDSAQAA
jgi:hypothetical protein